jgi:hypothetical protein
MVSSQLSITEQSLTKGFDMAKIADIVKLKTGYANFVELKSAFEADQENADRMAMYRPTKAHREAFERICKGLYQPNDKKFYLLSGSYGTGKSHLCLMTANVLCRSSHDPELAGFYENYARLDEEKARLLKNIRKDGQYLVAICDYHSGRNFEDVVMKAVFEACHARGLDPQVETEFDEAERQLNEWEQKGGSGGIRNFYQDFQKALESVDPGLSAEQLRKGLQEYNSELLDKFRVAFSETMGGIKFQPQSGNLIPIIKKLVRSQAFKDRFRGLAIFFDEFGFTLEKARYSKDILQGFMESVCRNEHNVLFVGCIHKDFKAYADRFSRDDAAVMSARITQVDLLNEGIEEIIGAIVETDKDSQTWNSVVAPRTGIFDQLVPVCKSLQLFPWIDDVERIRQKVLEDIYGVHPMALSCLLRLSSEIGSDARSTFTFFSGDVGGQTGSYAEYIQKADLIAPSGKLNLYTVDQLFVFFSRELSQKNQELREQQRQFVNGYFASLDALRKAVQGEMLGFQEDDIRARLLKTILIYQLCRISTNLENIQFGLYFSSSQEKKSIEKHLKELVKAGAVFFRRQSRTYELSASTGEDPYDLIERFVSDHSLHPADPVRSFLDEATGSRLPEFSEAKGYNLPFSEDKRLKIRFVPAKDLGPALWDEVDSEFQENRYKPAKSYEGTMVYALCENDVDVNLAKSAAKTINLQNILLAVSHTPLPFTETMLKVRACRHYLPPNEAEKITAQTESRLRDILENYEDGYLPDLQRTYRSLTEGSGSCWYWHGGQVMVDQPRQPHKPADMLCESLFNKRCLIKHPDLNLCHDDKWQSGRNTALKQAVDNLLQAERVFIDNGNPDNHGQKRYLEKVLLRGTGALKKTGSDGSVAFFVCEADPSVIHDDFPVLKELCSRIARARSGEDLHAASFFEEMREAPYGAGGTPLVLSLAHVIRAYGERLVVFKDSTKMVEQMVRSYDDIAGMVSSPACQTVFVVRDITSAHNRMIERVAATTGAPPLRHGESRSLNSAFESLKEWWLKVPAAAKITDLYDKERRTRLLEFKNVMDDITGKVDPFDFVLHKLPAVYTSDSVDAPLTDQEADVVCEDFAQDVDLINSGQRLIQNKVAQEICAVFGETGDMIECEKIVRNWYENLSSRQRDPLQCDQDDARQILTRLSSQPDKIRQIILETIPEDFGFKPVLGWTSLHVKDYAAKFKQAKKEIDQARPVVYKPGVKEGFHSVKLDQSMYVSVPEGAQEIVYTTDGSDPRKAEHVFRSSTEINLVELLKNNPMVTVVMRSVDKEGNYSDQVKLELADANRKHEVVIKNTLSGSKAHFRYPQDKEGLIAVMKSLLDGAVKTKILEREIAGQIEAEIIRLIK